MQIYTHQPLTELNPKVLPQTRVLKNTTLLTGLATVTALCISLLNHNSSSTALTVVNPPQKLTNPLLFNVYDLVAGPKWLSLVLSWMKAKKNTYHKEIQNNDLPQPCKYSQNSSTALQILYPYHQKTNDSGLKKEAEFSDNTKFQSPDNSSYFSTILVSIALAVGGNAALDKIEEARATLRVQIGLLIFNLLGFGWR